MTGHILTIDDNFFSLLKALTSIETFNNDFFWFLNSPVFVVLLMPSSKKNSSKRNENNYQTSNSQSNNRRSGLPPNSTNLIFTAQSLSLVQLCMFLEQKFLEKYSPWSSVHPIFCSMFCALYYLVHMF